MLLNLMSLRSSVSKTLLHLFQALICDLLRSKFKMSKGGLGESGFMPIFVQASGMKIDRSIRLPLVMINPFQVSLVCCTESLLRYTWSTVSLGVACWIEKVCLMMKSFEVASTKYFNRRLPYLAALSTLQLLHIYHHEYIMLIGRSYSTETMSIIPS